MADGSYILGIHIADVYSLGITPATPTSIEAKSRASLKQNIDKNAISLFVEVSNTGLIVDRKILMTTINVNNNLLYDDVSKIFSNKSNDKLHQTVVDLIGLYNIVDNSKLPEFPGPSAIAHALVQKYMLLYGCVASKIATEKNYPILFNASDNKVSEVTLDEVHINTGFIDNNLTTYARFTSPIWDVRSFINQASICECILGRLDTIELKTWRQKMRGYGRTINKELRQRLKNYDTKRNGLQ